MTTENAELIEALEDLCASVEREEEVNSSISGTLMADVRIARAAIEQHTRIEPEAAEPDASEMQRNWLRCDECGRTHDRRQACEMSAPRSGGRALSRSPGAGA